MIWSFSDSRKFRSCQRQWYFDAVVAHPRAKDPLRHKAYLLSKLQSIQSWRGNLIDYVISRYVIGGRIGKEIPAIDETINFARQTFDQQVKFAHGHRLHEQGMKPSAYEGEFAAWHMMEYGQGVSNAEINGCWHEVETAIINFYNMPNLLSTLSLATWLVAQRALTFEIDGFTIRAVPDLIVFRRNQPPLIIDWKAYVNDSQDHRWQLACYAVALKACKPHKDFPKSLSYCSTAHIELMEIQLLTKKQRQYKFSEEDYGEVEEFITRSAIEMQLSLMDLSRTTTEPNRFPVTNSPFVCSHCAFKSLCWED
ncbi:MAG: PD-(D/E)XK nuclease family protein [Caldilineaceae bacterium]